MSKVAGEVTAASFHARTGADIYGLRINNVIEPEEYAELFPRIPRRPVAAAAQPVRLHRHPRPRPSSPSGAWRPTGSGYEIFNVANADLSVAATTGGAHPTVLHGGSRCAARWVATRRSTPSTRPAISSATALSTPGVTSLPTRAAAPDLPRGHRRRRFDDRCHGFEGRPFGHAVVAGRATLDVTHEPGHPETGQPLGILDAASPPGARRQRRQQRLLPGGVGAYAERVGERGGEPGMPSRVEV